MTHPSTGLYTLYILDGASRVLYFRRAYPLHSLIHSPKSQRVALCLSIVSYLRSLRGRAQERPNVGLTVTTVTLTLGLPGPSDTWISCLRGVEDPSGPSRTGSKYVNGG